MRRSLPLFPAVALLLAAFVVLVASLLLAQPADNRSLAATYAHGVLRVAIPDDSPRTGEGTLSVEILDPEDAVAAHVERRAYAIPGRGLWRQEVALPKTLPF